MTENSSLIALLTLLQHSDSFFPSGTVAFSWGLESLITDQKIHTANELKQFIITQLYYRWASSDRAFLTVAYQAGDDLSVIQHADQLQDAMTLAKELREGSRRSGATLLSVHAQLNTPNAQPYRKLVQTEQAPGHTAIVQGLIGRSLQLTLEQTHLMSIHTFCVNILSAAIRLSLIGHLDSQRILNQLYSAIATLLLKPVPSLHETFTYTPALDVAAMRHESQFNRLFSN